MENGTGPIDAALALASASRKTATPKATDDIDKAREAAVEFEAVFIAQMLKPMFEDLETNGLFGGGNAEEMNRSMMLDEYGKQIAKSGGIGLADQVMAEILKIQEMQ
ncbi:rod-binding protein [Marivibrio halodurans]|uniref:Rod-binding protein n=1 Tax=Marivibrio halodurans TaxID=2039722 RepID=A0A8J7SIB6_9PROT|nr:rod-binding protein [Marivibrio halodurans]MBP5856973.1 rod-binding protein [Marivibrio halodurans]